MCRFGSTTESVIPSDPELHAECVQACQSTWERRDHRCEKHHESQPTKFSLELYYRPEIANTVFPLRSTTGPSERQVDACGTHEVGYCALAFFLLDKAAVNSVVHFTELCAGMCGFQVNKELRSKFISGTEC
jgi:hypothetical protein